MGAARLDHGCLEELRELGALRKNKNYLRELVEVFVRESRAALTRIEAAERAQDTELLKKILHSQKSTCGAIGAEAPRRLCARWEKTLGGGQSLNTQPKWRQSFEAELRATERELNAALFQ